MSEQSRSKDPLAIAFWTIFIVVNGTFLLPGLGGVDPGLLRAAIALVPLLAISHRALGSRELRERRLWAGLAAAVTLMWLAGILYQLQPPDGIVPFVALDVVYAAAYFLLVLAVRADPGHRTGNKLDKAIELAGTLVLVAGFFVYFVAIAAARESGEYATWRPSLLFYIALDLIVLLEAARLWFANRANDWRSVYGWLTIYAVTCIGADALDAVANTGALRLAAGSPWEILWNLPAIPIFLATRVAAIDAPTHTPAVPDAHPSILWPWHRRTVLLSMSVFLLIHFSQDWFGLLDAATHTAREIVLIVSLFLLGVLAIIQQSLLDREAREMAADRETAIQDAERRTFFLNSLVEHAPLAIVVLDPQHHVQVCNPAFEKLFQYDRTESFGRSLDELITRHDSIQEARQITRQVEMGQSIEATVRRYRKDGTPVTVELTGLPMTENGKLVGIFGVYQDISDRIEALRALRDSEARYRTLVEHAPEAIVILDAESGHFTDCNRQALQLFSLSRDELLSRGPVGLSPAKQPNGMSSETLSAILVREAAEGGQRVFEWTHLDSAGREISCEVRLTRMPARGRTLLRGSIIDISERLELQQQLRQVQRMEAVGQLAGGVAHDFNNLLTVIGGYCDLAMQRPDLSDDLRTELGEIHRAGDRASALTRQLLAFSRRQIMRLETVNLNRIVGDTEEMLRPLLGEQVELQTRLDSDLGNVHVDPGQVEQVITNLVVNARDALPGGGTIEISTGTETVHADGAFRPTDLEPGRYVTLKVADGGTGMDRLTLDHIFEPFFTTKEHGKGTGLGLSTVYGIVAQCGGHIAVDSRVGVGSTFTVYLPLVHAEDRPPPPERSARMPTPASETVLLVEDEPAVRKLASVVLSETGFEVLAAASGEEALNLANERGGEIDLLLTDVILPGLNGREIAEQIRPTLPDLKVLYMSGYTDELIADQGGNGEVPFLQKPFTPAGLVLKVREVLDTGVTEST